MDVIDFLLSPGWIIGIVLTAAFLYWCGVTDPLTLIILSVVIGLPVGWVIEMIQNRLVGNLIDRISKIVSKIKNKGL